MYKICLRDTIAWHHLFQVIQQRYEPNLFKLTSCSNLHAVTHMAATDIDTSLDNPASPQTKRLLHQDIYPGISTQSDIQHTSLFVALGLGAHEPGHMRVAETVQSLGNWTPYHESLWRVNSRHDLDKSFKQINSSMIDRRIDGTAGLLMLDPNEGYVKWHLRRDISDVLRGCWHMRNNIFIAFTLENPAANYRRIVSDIQALGLSAPIGKSIWYSSASYTSKEVFRILISSMDSGDELMVFDHRGNIALWHDGHGAAARAYRERINMPLLQPNSPTAQEPVI